MKIVKMVLLLLAINHILACVWYVIAIGHTEGHGNVWKRDDILELTAP